MFWICLSEGETDGEAHRQRKTEPTVLFKDESNPKDPSFASKGVDSDWLIGLVQAIFSNVNCLKGSGEK